MKTKIYKRILSIFVIALMVSLSVSVSALNSKELFAQSEMLIMENSYVSVVDGHQLSIVTKLWDPTLNDFICSLTVGVS